MGSLYASQCEGIENTTMNETYSLTSLIVHTSMKSPNLIQCGQYQHECAECLMSMFERHLTQTGR